MQTDTIGFNEGFNLYSYVGNDPLTFIDPTGTQEALFLFSRPVPNVTPLENALRVSPEPIPPTTIAEAVGRTLAEAAQRPSTAPKPGSSDFLKQQRGESYDQFVRRITDTPEKTKPEIGRESVRPEAPDHSWLADLAEAIYRAVGGGGSPSVTITPLPPDWQNGDGLPPSPAPPEPDKPEYRCPGGWPEDECTA